MKKDHVCVVMCVRNSVNVVSVLVLSQHLPFDLYCLSMW